jgi:AcrR family transcriptional regulator
LNTEPVGPRDQLLARATDYVTEHGIGDVSLRGFAAALGTSHRMLIYHFGSREGLLAAIVTETERRQRVAFAAMPLESDADLIAAGRAMWSRFADPAVWPLERLFFEVYGRALQGAPGTERFLQTALEPWIGPLAELHRQRGASTAVARARARLSVAVVRGLLLDLLATGDRRGVDRAMEEFFDLVPRHG